MVCEMMNLAELCTEVDYLVPLYCLRQNQVVINYNKLHADPKQGKNLDISKCFVR